MKSKNPTAIRRSGTVLVLVLVVLTVMMLLAGNLTRSAVSRHREARWSEREQQVRWLLESGRQRAIQAMAKSPDYRGETWRLPATAFSDGSAATIEIRVERRPAPPQAGKFVVEATWAFPDSASWVRQRVFTFTSDSGYLS